MKVFVIFWLNMDNFRGVIVGSEDMSKEMAVEEWFEETFKGFKNPPFNLADLFAVEDKYFIDRTIKK